MSANETITMTKNTSPYELLLGMALLKEKKSQLQQYNAEKLSDWSALLLSVGNVPLLISQDGIDEIIPLPSITKIPGSNHWLLGVINFHGELLPLIRLNLFLELNQQEKVLLENNEKENRALVVKTPYGLIGFVVDAVKGIKHYWSDDDIKIKKGKLQGKLSKYCKTQLYQEKQNIPVLDINNIKHSKALSRAVVNL